MRDNAEGTHDAQATLDTAHLNLGGKVTTVIKSEDGISKAEKALIESNSISLEEDGDIFDKALSDDNIKVAIIKPTYDPTQLAVLTQQNNTLMQCITAMEVNIDGTGFAVERRDGEPVSDKDEESIQEIEYFFGEAYPGESFTKQRRELRRDLEDTGGSYLEVMRNTKEEITFLKPMNAKLTRLVKHSDPVEVAHEITRGKTKSTVRMLVRERRYVQIIGSKAIFFKEFGATRNLNKYTGEWESDTSPVKTEDKATEVIHFTLMKDIFSNYGIPRWINQIPSVLGSRKAEEFNLDFFNSGGMPPVMILVQGGALTAESRTALTSYLAAPAKAKQRGILTEIFSTSGDLSSSGNVKVTVERFGAERQSDAMFMKYDNQTSEHVRMAFRLPPLFLGLSQEYNFATAYTAYMVAEAQIFKPERLEFDEVINNKIMKERFPDYVIRSLPISVTDIAQQLEALELSKDTVDKENWIEQLNEVSSLNLTLPEEPLEDTPPKKEEGEEEGEEETDIDKSYATVKVTGDDEGRISKLDDGVLLDLANDWSKHLTGEVKYTEDSVQVMVALIKSLAPPLYALFCDNIGGKVVDRELLDAGSTFEVLSLAGEIPESSGG